MKKACILLASPRKQGNTAARTAPFAAELDRLVYGMNKYYGREKGPSLWEGKPVALIATCGYPVEKGADLWEAGMQRYCKHSRLRLLGMLAQRHRGYDTVIMDPEKARLAAYKKGGYPAAFAAGEPPKLTLTGQTDTISCRRRAVSEG